MTVPVLVGIDLGTSGVKVVALGLDGTVHAEAAREYPVRSPAPGQAETHPADWWDAVVAALGEALSSGRLEVAGIGVDGQMHGLVLADEDGSPIRPALLWADSRATSEVSAWQALPDELLHKLANPLSPGMTGPLLLWVRRNEPAAYERAHIALLPKDWVRHRLTGDVATDPSDASATLLWDVPGDRWADDVVRGVGLDPGLLPPVRPSGERAGVVSARGLPRVDAGVPVATGCADTAAALLATGLTDPLDPQISVGTGAQIVRPVHDPVVTPDPRTHLYRSAAAEGARWYAMAAVQNAGLALDWVRRVLGLGWDELYAAAERPPGADGVTFVPYLTGERSPVLNAHARGAWLGLDLAGDRASLAQAAVEGVAFAIRHALEALPSASKLEHARLVGGGIAAPAFRTLLADVLGMPLHPIGVRSASAVGAAMLAASAAGLPVPPPPVTADPVVHPTHRAKQYEPLYHRYRDHAEHIAAK